MKAELEPESGLESEPELESESGLASELELESMVAWEKWKQTQPVLAENEKPVGIRAEREELALNLVGQ